MMIRAPLVSLGVAALAVQVGSTQTPQFRADVQYVEIPVIAVDQSGAFVKDIGQQELQVFEDGRPQEISTFRLTTVPLPTAAIPKRPSENRVGPMTVSDLRQLDGRIYLIVVDDYHIRSTDTTRTRSVLQDFVRNHLRTNDAAAVVYTSGFQGQEFTQDRVLLLAAVEHIRGSFTSDEPDSVRESKAQSTLSTITTLAATFNEVERHRKALLLVTPFVGCVIGQGVLRDRDESLVRTTPLYQSRAFEGNAGSSSLAVFTCSAGALTGIQTAIQSNTTIYAIDPRGSEVTDYVSPQIDGRGGPGSALRRADRLNGTNNSSGDAMFPLATETGGFVVTGTNAFDKALQRIVREQSEYYVLGYYSTNTVHDGKQRKTSIALLRKGVTLTYRSTYFAPSR